MKIIVFGGSGFIGSHVADTLAKAGNEVTIFDWTESPYLLPEHVMVLGDINDPVDVTRAVIGQDVVYNFAGTADIGECEENPVDAVNNNIIGNMVILDACRFADIKRFVFASSIYIYSDSASFYRDSKRASEAFIRDYQEVYGLPYTILRFGSLYGRRADESNLIHRLLKQAISKGKVTYPGTGSEQRQYINVLDAAQICVDILDPRYENQTFIITGQQDISAQDLLVLIDEMLNHKIAIEIENQPNHGHYQVTPYSFHPIIAKELRANPGISFGNGILDCIAEIYERSNHNSQG